MVRLASIVRSLPRILHVDCCRMIIGMLVLDCLRPVLLGSRVVIEGRLVERRIIMVRRITVNHLLKKARAD